MSQTLSVAFLLVNFVGSCETIGRLQASFAGVFCL
jgi:hypothetical protein